VPSRHNANDRLTSPSDNTLPWRRLWNGVPVISHSFLNGTMNIPRKRFIAAKLLGITGTLERAPASDKNKLIALHLAHEFNEILKAVSDEYPGLAPSLPRPLSTRGPMIDAGKAPASFLDLEIACEQVLNLLDLVDD
jgi:hypothetical protein